MKFCLSDTVGFIERFRYRLRLFQIGLCWGQRSRFLLHVIDISENDFENQVSTVNGILE